MEHGWEDRPKHEGGTFVLCPTWVVVVSPEFDAHMVIILIRTCAFHAFHAMQVSK